MKTAKPESPAVEAAITRLASVLTMASGATDKAAQYAISALRISIGADAAFMAGAIAITGRIKDHMAELDAIELAEQTRAGLWQ